MRPVSNLRRSLVHPKDKLGIDEVGEVVYEVPCMICDKKYIGETGRLLRTRMEERCNNSRKRNIHKIS